jgi:dihydroorotate dehydrogenase (fumarate)
MLATKIADVELQKFAFNASGINNEILKQLQKIAASDSAAVMFKSCTLEPRKGNENPKYIVKSDLIPGCTFNSMGLPNKGLEANLEFIKNLKETTHKPVIFSSVGIQNPLQENKEIITRVQEQGLVDLIEVNLSCPNIEGEGVLGYDFNSLEKMITDLSQIPGKAKIGFKLPPYTDISHFSKVSKILLNSQTAFITSINTLPGLVIDPVKGSTIIKPKEGQGGLGGIFLKPLALYNVRQFYQRLENKISIIGVGGIASGSDAFEFLLAGADAVQVGSGLAHYGLDVFEKIHLELEQILTEKGYKNLLEAKGKLKLL